jgi:dGTPase
MNTYYEIEDALLARYACKSKNSKGRRFPEEEHPYRSPYQRDRDRIIHSVAFRRLEYKTQVFVNHEGDDYRTRLTHSLEVSQIARTIAKALQLNEELTESLALAHDLGHTPFGHAAEEMLNKLMFEHGGFEHNLHTLRIVDELEERYPEFPGLNLTWETREGIIKHQTKYDKAKIPAELEPLSKPTLEAQIVDIADEIAYDNHDIDDGLGSGLLLKESLGKIELWQQAKKEIEEKYPSLTNPKLRYQIIRRLISLFVTDAIEESRKRLKEYGVKDVDDVRRMEERIIDFSVPLKNLRIPLRSLLSEELYHHYRVNRMSEKAQHIIKKLFNAYIGNTTMLPKEFQNKISNKTNKYVVVCDYIASMTDRFAIDEYEKLFNPHKKV